MRPAKPLAERPRSRATGRPPRTRATTPRLARPHGPHTAVGRPATGHSATAQRGPGRLPAGLTGLLPAWLVRLLPAGLVRLLPDRLRSIGPEAARFLAVGLANTVVNFAVFNALILTVFATGQLKANVAATAVATVTSYLMNRHWTYRDRPRAQKRREFALFVFFNLAGLAIELLVLAGAKYGLAMTSVLAVNAAKVLGLVLGTVFRFWSYRTFVFIGGAAAAPRPRRATAGQVHPPLASLPAPVPTGAPREPR